MLLLAEIWTSHLQKVRGIKQIDSTTLDNESKKLAIRFWRSRRAQSNMSNMSLVFICMGKELHTRQKSQSPDFPIGYKNQFQLESLKETNSDKSLDNVIKLQNTILSRSTFKVSVGVRILAFKLKFCHPCTDCVMNASDSGVESAIDQLLLPGLKTAHTIFLNYLAVAIGIVGLVNNLLSALVFGLNLSEFPPSCLYFLALSICDLCAVFFVGIINWLTTALASFGLRAVDLYSQSLAACRSLRYLQLTSITAAPYLTVALSFERAACLAFPVRFVSFFTVRRRVAIVIGVVAVPAVLWTQVFGTLELRPWFINDTVLGCYLRTRLPELYVLAFNYQLIFLSNALPTALILVGNLVALHGYLRNRMRRTETPGDADSHDSDVKVTMVMLSLQHLVLNLPSSICYPLFSFLSAYGYETTNPKMFYNVFYITDICNVVTLANLSINFYFYLYKVKRFRSNLLGAPLRRFRDLRRRYERPPSRSTSAAPTEQTEMS